MDARARSDAKAGAGNPVGQAPTGDGVKRTQVRGIAAPSDPNPRVGPVAPVEKNPVGEDPREFRENRPRVFERP